MINIQTSSLILAVSLAFSSVADAGPTRTYQVTGPILELNESMMAVQKGKERWELARDSSTKANGEMKVGDKVTITYTMTATKVEVKAAKPADSSKPAADAAASPVPSPEKK